MFRASGERRKLVLPASEIPLQYVAGSRGEIRHSTPPRTAHFLYDESREEFRTEEQQRATFHHCHRRCVQLTGKGNRGVIDWSDHEGVRFQGVRAEA